jgi:hypothetical protein
MNKHTAIGMLIVIIVFILGVVGVVTVVKGNPDTFNPPSIQQVATSFGCTDFQDHGPALMTTDSGSCWINGRKYGINTFASIEDRDDWLNAAEKLGVNPKYYSATAVLYPNVPQS